MSNKLINVLLVLLLIEIQLISTIPFECGTDDLLKTKKLIKVNVKDDKRNLESEEYHPINILFDVTGLHLETLIFDDEYVFEKVKSALTEVEKEFQQILKVKTTGNLVIPKDKIEECIDVYDPTITTTGANADVVIYPYFANLEGNKISQAAPCLQRDSDNRPIAGVLVISPLLATIKNLPNFETYIKNIFLHEITHILVFTPELIKSFSGKAIQQVTGKNGLTYSAISTPKVMEKARQHFNCDSLTEMYLENQEENTNSAGTHWDARYMLGDYMISTSYPEMVLSDITLALFEDSGWYKVNYYTGGLFRFGKGRGCSFFSEKCVNNGNTNFPNEFCVDEKKDKCTSGHLMRGYCEINYDSNIPSQFQYFSDPTKGGFPPADYCPVTNGDETNSLIPLDCKSGTSLYPDEFGEKIGDNSICVISNLMPKSSSQDLSKYNYNRAICHEIECDFQNKQTKIKIGSNTIICPTTGGKIKDPNNFTGELECPEFNIVCTSTRYCNDISSCMTAQSLTYDGSSTADGTGAYRKKTTDSKILREKGLIYLLLVSLLLL